MKIYKIDFLLTVLEVSREEFFQILEEKENAYQIFEISKKGGTRQIYGLDEKKGKRLKTLQQRLYRKILSKQPLALSAKGFLKGKSYLSFLEPHIGNDFFLRLDICDFFGSFSEKLIKRSLETFIIDEEAKNAVYELCTIDGKIPQGAVTSPVLSNIMFARFDQRILKYCQTIEEREYERKKESWINVSLCYTRYADDMLFSSNFFVFKENLSFLRMISRILSEGGFRINREKTIITEKELSLNGYVVGKDIRLSRKKTEKIRRILYCVKDTKTKEYLLDKRIVNDSAELQKRINRVIDGTPKSEKTFSNIQEIIWYLAGCRSWIIAILRAEENTGKENKNMKKMVRRIESLLDALEEIES